MSPLVGGIEAGGTKFVCAVGTGPNDIRDQLRIATTTPRETIGHAIRFFQSQREKLGPLSAIGIASFGPIDPVRRSPTFGYITSTPKPGWGNIDFAGSVGRALDIPVGFDTDVNVAALVEWRWGAGQGVENLIYLTIGTGIGGGGLVNGRLMHGLIHPEMGHIRIPHDLQADPYPGHCPYHGDCLEGLACGPAMNERWQQASESLPPDHPAWALEANYLALALVNFICTLSPERIVLGGGVMSQTQLIGLVRDKVQQLLNEYVQSPAILSRVDEYIVSPALGDRSGVLGAFALAQQLVARGTC
ncbi:MAG: ROK family protein [Planctomycetia bacterium]|nr:ROK family protein [Planctomycetia bacterium]